RHREGRLAAGRPAAARIGERAGGVAGGVDTRGARDAEAGVDSRAPGGVDVQGRRAGEGRGDEPRGDEDEIVGERLAAGDETARDDALDAHVARLDAETREDARDVGAPALSD